MTTVEEVRVIVEDKKGVKREVVLTVKFGAEPLPRKSMSTRKEREKFRRAS